MNKIKLGFFSFSDLPDPAEYVQWHQLDHMPEQFRIAGLSWGQRFVATADCQRAALARTGPFTPARHLQNYLMEDPLRVIGEFNALGRELAGLGRMRTDIVSCGMAYCQLLETHAAPRVLISPEAVPYRPYHGAYVIVEEITDPGGLDAWVRAQHQAGIPALLDLAGVVGMWSYAATGAYGTRVTNQRHTMIYLDDDPVEVAGALTPLLAARWENAPVHPVLAGPFVSYFRPPVLWNAEQL